MNSQKFRAFFDTAPAPRTNEPGLRVAVQPRVNTNQQNQPNKIKWKQKSSKEQKAFKKEFITPRLKLMVGKLRLTHSRTNAAFYGMQERKRLFTLLKVFTRHSDEKVKSALRFIVTKLNDDIDHGLAEAAQRRKAESNRCNAVNLLTLNYMPSREWLYGKSEEYLKSTQQVPEIIKMYQQEGKIDWYSLRSFVLHMNPTESFESMQRDGIAYVDFKNKGKFNQGVFGIVGASMVQSKGKLGNLQLETSLCKLFLFFKPFIFTDMFYKLIKNVFFSFSIYLLIILGNLFQHVAGEHRPRFLAKSLFERIERMEVTFFSPAHDLYTEQVLMAGCLSSNGTRPIRNNHSGAITRFVYFPHHMNISTRSILGNMTCLAATAVAVVVNGVVSTCTLENLREIACPASRSSSSSSSSSSSNGGLIGAKRSSAEKESTSKKQKTI